MKTSTSNTTDETVERVKAGAHEAMERVVDAATRATDAIGAKTEQMKDAEQRLIAHTRTYIIENPLTSLAIAVGSGFILSRLMSHR